MQIVRSSCFTLLLGAFLAVAASAQTAPNGQVMAPGTSLNGTTACPTLEGTSASVTATTDANCANLAPGFAAPSINSPVKEPDHVTAVIRVNAVVDKPTATPFPIEFNVVGDATMVKASLPRLNACFAVGRGWSRRTGSATSTTCVSKKGDVIAYQECKPGATTDVQPTCSTAMPKAGESTVAAIR